MGLMGMMLGYEWQETTTQDFISADWVRRSLPKDELKRLIIGHTHCRMVSITVGCGLNEHADAKELLCAARDVFDGGFTPRLQPQLI